MRLEVAADGIVISVDRRKLWEDMAGEAPPPEYLATEALALTLAEAEALAKSLPQAIERLREKVADRQAYEIRSLRSRLQQMEGQGSCPMSAETVPTWPSPGPS